MSEDKIAGTYSKCPICNYKDFNFFLSGKELISEFVNDLKKDDIFETLFDYRLYIDKVIEKWEK